MPDAPLKRTKRTPCPLLDIGIFQFNSDSYLVPHHADGQEKEALFVPRRSCDHPCCDENELPQVLAAGMRVGNVRK